MPGSLIAAYGIEGENESSSLPQLNLDLLLNITIYVNTSKLFFCMRDAFYSTFRSTSRPVKLTPFIVSGFFCSHFGFLVTSTTSRCLTTMAEATIHRINDIPEDTTEEEPVGDTVVGLLRGSPINMDTREGMSTCTVKLTFRLPLECPNR